MSMDYSKVRVRFAPSPTGFLHVGGLRTALFNFLFAKKNHGLFVLRIEDTDKSREVSGALENIIDSLKLFHLDFDEGPAVQSSRLQIYKEHIETLLEKGAAYKCFCSGERIAALKKQAELLKQPFRYDKHCLKNPRQTGKSFVIRQNIPEEGMTSFHDEVYGDIRIENRLLDDGVLVKTDGYPVYNFANVVDDHLMQITHVIRGEEFISSTPKHILLYQAFGWELPKFIHLPLILDKQKQKLSKRAGDVAVKDYLNKGYLPEAILNFIAFLGWNPKTEDEIFSLAGLIEAFEISKINRSGAVFDLDKLNWFNSHYIRNKTADELITLVSPYFPSGADKYPESYLQKIVEMEKDRLVTLSEIGERVIYFFQIPDYPAELLKWKNMSYEEIRDSLERSKKIIDQLKISNSKKEIEKVFFAEIGENDKGNLLWPLRVALTGLKASPGPFEIIEAFLIRPGGKAEIQNRLQGAIAKIC